MNKKSTLYKIALFSLIILVFMMSFICTHKDVFANVDSDELLNEIMFQKIECLPDESLSLTCFAVSDDEMVGGAVFEDNALFFDDDYSYIVYKFHEETFYYKVYNPNKKYVTIGLDSDALILLYSDYSCVVTLLADGFAIEELAESNYSLAFFDEYNIHESILSNGTTYKLKNGLFIDKLIRYDNGKHDVLYRELSSTWVQTAVLFVLVIIYFTRKRYIKRKQKNKY